MIYRKTYLGLTSPGAAIVLPIPAGRSGRVTRFVVTQTGGTTAGFTAGLYETYAAAVLAAGGLGVNVPNLGTRWTELSSEDNWALPTPVPDSAAALHQVVPTLTAANAVATASAFLSSGESFVCDANVNNINRSSKLFLVITPATNNTGKTFSTTICIETDE